MSIPPSPANLPIVDSSGRPTPAFLKLLQQFNISATDTMPAPTTLNLQADYTGTFLTGELPANVVLSRTYNGKDVTGQCQWAMTTISGMITASISDGIITITALSSSSAVLQVRSMRAGVALYCNVTVNKVQGAIPVTGSSGGASASATTFTAITSSVYAAITGNLSVVVGASGNVSLTAPLSVSTSKTPPAGDYPVFGKWQWWNGAAWADVAAEVQSSPDCVVTAYPEDGTSTIIYIITKGTLTANATQGGLTPGATAKFQLLARNGAGTRGMTFSGTASVVPQ